eukprot:COSAG06_NODE_133_length_22471_cov_57.507286_3_plen_101_part_00
MQDNNTCGNRLVQNCSILPHTAYVTAKAGEARTQVSCAEACARANYSTAGVEYGVACFCGDIADGRKGISVVRNYPLDNAAARVAWAARTSCSCTCSGEY